MDAEDGSAVVVLDVSPGDSAQAGQAPRQPFAAAVALVLGARQEQLEVELDLVRAPVRTLFLHQSPRVFSDPCAPGRGPVSAFHMRMRCARRPGRRHSS